MTDSTAGTVLRSAPPAPGAVDATVVVPGATSVTARALILAALAAEPGWLRRPPRTRDALLIAEALRAMGIGVEETVSSATATAPDAGVPGDHGESWRIIPATPHGPADVDVTGALGAARLLLPFAALAEGEVRFTGTPDPASGSPAGTVAALRALGARVDDGGRGAFPLSVHGTGPLNGGTVALDVAADPRTAGALLLCGARCNRGVEIRHVPSDPAATRPGGPGDPGALPDRLPHLGAVVASLRAAGARVDAPESGGRPGVWRVAPGALLGRDVVIEPDPVAALPFLSAAMVTGGRVTVPDWPARIGRPTDALPDVLTALGARCSVDDHGLTVVGAGPLGGVELDLRGPAAAATGSGAGWVAGVLALAALAEGDSVLRVRRADVPDTVIGDLLALGADITEAPDAPAAAGTPGTVLRVRPRPLRGAPPRSADPRRAAVAALLALASATPGASRTTGPAIDVADPGAGDGAPDGDTTGYGPSDDGGGGTAEFRSRWRAMLAGRLPAAAPRNRD
ncbi:3-phosphoshikimate 1-carboxyvinyltransferase [Streptomyces alkaliphilus]|uniref:3-phosphoshikimate 1-carboxyvinyltransferase n=1 Tax=Streptomyces alkaliphilus TaxID=1472722 RepID=UPI00117F2DDD|nr:3-phosphoshikimate 1-carboxyvinyltransferase [Streptomyces alkaliphilus]MQS07090.1 3-phosphoshikimate 1-carboxyvinyltransferase [Streptomyces alkaliphilus]